MFIGLPARSCEYQPAAFQSNPNLMEIFDWNSKWNCDCQSVGLGADSTLGRVWGWAAGKTHTHNNAHTYAMHIHTYTHTHIHTYTHTHIQYTHTHIQHTYTHIQHTHMYSHNEQFTHIDDCMSVIYTLKWKLCIYTYLHIVLQIFLSFCKFCSETMFTLWVLKLSTLL